MALFSGGGPPENPDRLCDDAIKPDRDASTLSPRTPQEHPARSGKVASATGVADAPSAAWRSAAHVANAGDATDATNANGHGAASVAVGEMPRFDSSSS